jgi:hypothetical protein
VLDAKKALFGLLRNSAVRVGALGTRKKSKIMLRATGSPILVLAVK